MPTIHQESGFRFFFYSNEHPPPHVHVEKGEDAAKYNLAPDVILVENDRFKNPALKAIQGIIIRQREHFLRSWYEYFGDKGSG